VKEIITEEEERSRIIKEERVTKSCLDKEIGYGWRKE